MLVKKSDLKKKIRKALKEGNEFNRMDRRFCYRVMYDLEDAAIWADTFTEENSFKVYHSDTIKCLNPFYEDYPDYFGMSKEEFYRLSKEEFYLRVAVIEFEKYGWEVEKDI